MFYTDFINLPEYEQKKVNIIEFEEGTKIIEDNALSKFENIKSIIIPQSVEKICDNAFAFTGIKKLILPDSIKTIGGCICYGCNNLRFAKIPSNIEKFGNFNFAFCNNLEKIFFKDRSFKEEAFLDAYLMNGDKDFSDEITLDELLELGVPFKNVNEILKNVNVER